MTFKPESLQPNLPGIDRVKNAKLGGGVDSFVGFTYSAACAVAEVDILTGEAKILSSDIVYGLTLARSKVHLSRASGIC
jgi:xanthine dehydrogenase/oxidase